MLQPSLADAQANAPQSVLHETVVSGDIPLKKIKLLPMVYILRCLRSSMQFSILKALKIYPAKTPI